MYQNFNFNILFLDCSVFDVMHLNLNGNCKIVRHKLRRDPVIDGLLVLFFEFESGQRV